MSFLSLLLAVTTLAQDTVGTVPARPRAPKRVWAPTIPPGLETAAALASSHADLQVLISHSAAQQAPALALQASAYALQAPAITMAARAIAMQLSPLAMSAAAELETAAIALDALPDVWEGDEESDVWDQQDPADSLYRAARQALNRNQYSRAAELFRSVRDRYPRSDVVGNTYYWEAFALYRTGSDDALRTARTALRTQADRFPKATTRRDAEVLMRRIQGVLAQRGDEDAATAIARDVDDISPMVAPTPPVATTPRVYTRPPKAPKAYRPGRHVASCNDDDEDDIRAAALNAMLQMDADRAVPILKTVLARRDTGSTCLRRKAVWLVSQKRSSETAAILLDAVRNDPDKEVREQGIFWLSQVPGEETVIALDSVLRASDDVDVQDKAIFALSQHNSQRSAATLRAYAERQDVPMELREKAIFWLGQRRSQENANFLRGLYAKLENDELKDKVLFSVSQMGGAENYRFLMDIALNQNEDIELRKKALFWAGQGRSVDMADLVRLYDSMKDREMREQLIFVYSQRRDGAALDKLFQIAKNDPDRELRKKAIFWIGQSRDPRAAQFLQELISQ
jgi:TolA-binding protein/HEAT repeat protein